jgi:MYXO-CTERM domain-containing protein
MKQLSSIGFIVACAITTSVATMPMTSPVSAQAQVNTPRTTTTERTYANNDNNDNSGLWGLAGLAGLFGLLGNKRRHDEHRTVMREDDAVYRDPSRR